MEIKRKITMATDEAYISIMDHSNAGDTGTLSMREKAQIKRRVNREHNSNFRAGYININEEYLHKTGIRGRKRYFFFCFVVSLVIIALLNALLTAGLVYVLHIYHTGMQDLEFVPSGPLRFLKDTYLDTVLIHHSTLGARYYKDLKISGVNSSLFFKSNVVNGSSITIDGERMLFTTNNINLVRSTTQLPRKNVVNLHALSVVTDKLASRQGYPDLFIESNKRVKFMGSEGLTLESVRKNIQVESTLGSIHLNASDSLHFNSSKIYISGNLPPLVQGSVVDKSRQNYKICVCMPSGRIFAVPVMRPGVGCNTLSDLKNPCDSL